MWLTPIRGWLFMKKTSETPMAAASLTKLMTMILMLESYQDQLDTISITAPGYIYDYLYGKMLPRRISGKTRPIPCAACCMPCCCPAPTRQRISWQTI